MKKATFTHRALDLQKEKPIIFTALSKRLFYFRMFICQYVLLHGGVPINPFMSFDYFLLDVVERDIVREANNNLMKKSDELWVFGPISDGVLVEMKIASKMGKPIKYFKVLNDKDIVECTLREMEKEKDVENLADDLS